MNSEKNIQEQRTIADVSFRQMDYIRRETYEYEKLYLLKSGLQDDLLTGRVRVPETIKEGAAGA